MVAVRWIVVLMINCSIAYNFSFCCSIIHNDIEELAKFLEDITDTFPELTELMELGRSYENRPIYCVRIGKKSTALSKERVVVVDFGIHAREWVTLSSAIHVITQLVRTPRLSDLVMDFTWYIIPLLNPDGFMYTKLPETATDAHRSWRKNRRPIPGNSSCIGVDLNRNFPTGWRKSSICDEEYSGPVTLSENETMAFHQFVSSLSGEIAAYISVHSNQQSILLPYACCHSIPYNYIRLYDVANAMKIAMEKTYAPKYAIRRASDVYNAFGTSTDWVYEKFQVPLVYILELPFLDRNYPDEFSVSLSEHCLVAAQTMAALEECARMATGVQNELKSPFLWGFWVLWFSFLRHPLEKKYTNC